MKIEGKFLENKIGESLPLFFNYVRCDTIEEDIVRIDMSYYDRRFYRRRDPVFSNEYLRILE